MAKVSKQIIGEVLQARLAKAPTNLLDTNFPEQNAFILDPERLKALWCTRRAAKSYTGGLYLIKTCLENEGVNCLFIGLTSASASGIIWKDILKTIDRKHNLGIKFNETKLTATFPNGSVIWLTGIDSKPDEMDKLLGKKYKLVILDESSLYSIDLHKLCYGILGPALADQQGTLCMLGTSSDIVQGLFFDITQRTEPGWSLHTWTASQNPHIAKQWAAELEEIRLKRPLFMETNLFKQWYLNQWVIDESKIVYRYNPKLNSFNILPTFRTGSWTYTLGVDLGHSPDPSAFVVSAYHDYDRTLYILETFSQLEMDITDVSDKIKYYIKKYGIYKTIIDGANKQAVAEMQKRHGLSLQSADKTGKSDFINLMNADFIQGYIKLQTEECDGLISEYKALTWATKAGKIVIPRKEKDGLANHECFIAGTKITTESGIKCIEDVQLVDKVLTRQGYKNIIRIGGTGNKKVMELIFSNGKKLVCTFDHPIFTINRGFISAKNLTKEDIFVEEELWKQFTIKDSNSIDIRKVKDYQMQGILQDMSINKENTYIDLCGKQLMEKFLIPGTFTIKTEISQITLLKILSALVLSYTVKNTKTSDKYTEILLRIKNYWKKFVLLQKNGTLLKKVMNGINIMLEILKKKIENKLTLLVLYAKKIISEIQWQLVLNIFAPPNVLLRKEEIQELITNVEYVQPVEKNLQSISIENKLSVVILVEQRILKEKTIVYNLEVEEAHEYFANGILVSNCDASLYNWRYCYQFLAEREPVKVDLISNWANYSEQSLREAEEKRQLEIQEQDNFNDQLAISEMDPFNDPTENAIHYFVNKRQAS